MNERINELELEATAYADSKVPANDRYNDIYHSIVRGKFAELIVGECVGILETEIAVGANTIVFNQAEWDKNNLHFTLLTNMVTLTKEHFGVEE